MAKKRKVYAPFSLTSEAGVAQTPVEGYIDVDQQIYPTVNTGTVNENGTWAGVKSDDEDFIGFTKFEAVASSGTFLGPDTNNHPKIDMTGFTDLQIAIKSSRSDTIHIDAVFGPDTESFANLTPIAAAAPIRIITTSRTPDETFDDALDDASELLVADAWVVFTILGRVKGQKNLQIKMTNNAGDPTNFEFAYRRLV